jgi:hypothetical protein
MYEDKSAGLVGLRDFGPFTCNFSDKQYCGRVADAADFFHPSFVLLNVQKSVTLWATKSFRQTNRGRNTSHLGSGTAIDKTKIDSSAYRNPDRTGVQRFSHVVTLAWNPQEQHNRPRQFRAARRGDGRETPLDKAHLRASRVRHRRRLLFHTSAPFDGVKVVGAERYNESGCMRAVMAAFWESCRHSGHVVSALFHPNRPIGERPSPET